MRPSFWRLCLIVPAAMSCGKGAPVTVSERSLGSVKERFNTPFTWIGGIRELSDGRVVVTDERERRLVLLDPKSNSLSPISRTGQGPNEYRSVGSLVALPFDSTMMLDVENHRLLAIDPSGETVGVTSLPASVGFGIEIKGSDDQGRLFLEANPMPDPEQVSEGGPPDSLPVLRWDRRSGRLDTVAYLGQRKVESGGSSGFVMFMIQPLSSRDDWGVASGGWVGIVRLSPYRVEWRGPGQEYVQGATQSYQPIPVTDRDKAEWEEEQKNAPTYSVDIGGGGAIGGPGGGPAPAPGPAPEMPDLKWPTEKPPFLERSLQISPDREAWVLRTRAAGDSIPVYDVFDAKGVLTERISLPPASRVIGFGRKSVYLVRTDDSGAQWLERYER